MTCCQMYIVSLHMTNILVSVIYTIWHVSTPGPDRWHCTTDSIARPMEDARIVWYKAANSESVQNIKAYLIGWARCFQGSFFKEIYWHLDTRLPAYMQSESRNAWLRWDNYDVRHGRRQTIHDAGNTSYTTTAFVKIPGRQHGASWAVWIKGFLREVVPEILMSSMIFYARMECFGSLRLKKKADRHGIFRLGDNGRLK